MKIGVCCRLEESSELSPAVGFIEEHTTRLLVPMEGDEAFSLRAVRARASLVPIRALNSFLPSDQRCVGAEVDVVQLKSYTARCLRRAAELGIDLVVFGSGRARACPAGIPRSDMHQQFVRFMRELAESARVLGVRVALEPLNRTECNFINTLDEAADVLRAADREALGLTADLYHMLRESEGPDSLVRNASFIRHVHVAEPARRTPPGVDGTDFRGYLAALCEIGYTGDLSIECRWRDMREECARAVDELSQQCSDVGLDFD